MRDPLARTGVAEKPRLPPLSHEGRGRTTRRFTAVDARRRIPLSPRGRGMQSEVVVTIENAGEGVLPLGAAQTNRIAC